MRLKALTVASAVAAACFAAAPAQAIEFQNGSFESNLAGWTADPTLVANAGLWNHFNGLGELDATYLPKHGAHMAIVQALQPQDAKEGDPPEPPTLLTQQFDTAGGWFQGWAAFLGRDELPFNDFAFVRVYSDTRDVQLFFADIQGVGNYGRTPWTKVYAYLQPGTYTFEAGVGNGFDPFRTSYLLLDNFRITDAIPEPSTWAMMIGGFFGMGAWLRRRRAAAA